MVRIFLGLAGLALLLIVSNLALGLMTGDYNGVYADVEQAARPLRERKDRLMRQSPSPVEELKKVDEELAAAFAPLQTPKGWVEGHVLLGIAAALVTVLVNSISVTYFIGTARWVREVVETYKIDPAISLRCDALKASTFPWSFGGIIAILLLAGLGAASHPGARFSTAGADWVLWHHVAAWLIVVVEAYSFWMQGECIATNGALIDEVLDEVGRIRKARGLPVGEEEDDAEEVVDEPADSKAIESGQGGTV